MPKVENVFGAVVFVSLFAAGSAFAGVGGSVTPTYPAGPVRVGDTFNASLTIVNDSDGANHAERIAVSNISHTPSCGSGTATCKAPDPGVFTVSTGTGAAQSACAGVTFDVSSVNASTGEVQFTPTRPWTLGPADNSDGPATCEIQFTVTVMKAPSQQGKAPGKMLKAPGQDMAGVQTSSLAHALFMNTRTPAQKGMGAGTSATNVVN